MIIKFRNGHKIKFKKFGKIWLAESVIFKGDEVRSLMQELLLVKAKINQWFEENAPDEIREKYNVRLPLWEEIKDLPFKDQIAYGEGRTDKISDYLLGDGDDTDTLICYAGYSYDCGWLSCNIDYIYYGSCPVRLCLEENLVFDEKKHRYAKLEDGSIEPLYYGDTNEPRSFYQTLTGKWYMDLDMANDNSISLMHKRIIEFLEDKK